MSAHEENGELIPFIKRVGSRQKYTHQWVGWKPSMGWVKTINCMGKE
nr:MAG TPA: hypothetical protein [Caudoviricetes sp.]